MLMLKVLLGLLFVVVMVAGICVCIILITITHELVNESGILDGIKDKIRPLKKSKEKE